MVTSLLLICGAIAVLVYFLDLYTRQPPPNAEELTARPGQQNQWEQQRKLGLRQLWPGDAKARGAKIDLWLTASGIIAIHGLDTQSPTTWKAYRNRKDGSDGYVHWLEDADMLHTRFPKARIFTYDWPSATYKDAVQDGLRGHANTFLDKVSHREHSDRHMVLIASCFGGLLLAQAVILASKRHHIHDRVLQSIKGILFLGTPFRKSDAGSAARVRVQVAKAMHGASSDELIRYLTKNDKSLVEIVEDFESIVIERKPKIELVCYYETKPTQIYSAILPKRVASLIPGGNFILVPKESASMAGSRSRPIHVTHALLNKFFSSADENFETVCEGLQDLIRQAEQSDLYTKLKEYYEHEGGRRLRIERLSGDRLPMDKCYINLCITEHERDYDLKTTRLGSHTADGLRSAFSLSSRLRVNTPPETKQVTLKTMFKPRKRMDDITGRPHRILVWGRAGVGKSTLCKKIVYDFIYHGLWKDIFDHIFWFSLRELKLDGVSSDGLENMILNKFFRPADHDALRNQLQGILQYRTLFILDGLDEVSYALDPDSSAGLVLRELLGQTNIIITSRPHSTNLLQATPPDLELETIGFFPDQVDEYLKAAKAHAPEALSQIQQFIQSHPVVRSLVRIPIQLDAICYCWSSDSDSTKFITMTTLYQDIEMKLWEKYIVLRNGSTLSRIQGSAAIVKLVEGGVNFLERLAFVGLYNEVIEFTTEHIKLTQMAQLKQHLMFNDDLVYTSFLRSSDHSIRPEAQSYHFIHLTFQEYFAARHFVRHWISQKDIALGKGCDKWEPVENQQVLDLRGFIAREKYNVRYDIFWRFVVGLLHGESSKDLHLFFETLESEPRDLLGPTHQRLVLHCLSEVHLVDAHSDLRTQILEVYSQWMLFEHRFSSQDHLRSQTECPEAVFISLLNGSFAEKDTGLEGLINRRNLSPKLLDMVMNESRINPNIKMRQNTYRILGVNWDDTSQQQLVDFWQDLQQSELGPRQEGAEGLRHTRLRLQHPAVKVLTLFLSDKDSTIQLSATKALREQKILSDTIVQALVSLIEDEKQDPKVRISAAEALRDQENLPEEVVGSFVQIIKNRAACLEVLSLLGGLLVIQTHLPDAAAETLIQFLRHKDSSMSFMPKYFTDHRVDLQERIIKIIIHLLENYLDTRHLVLLESEPGTGINVLRTTIRALKPLFSSQDPKIRSSAAEALGKRVQLLATLIKALTPLVGGVDSKTQKDAIWGLGGQLWLEESELEACEVLLRDEDITVRDLMTQALEQRKRLLEAAYKVLITVLENKSSRARDIALYVLDDLSPLPKSVIDDLMPFLEDEDPTVRLSTAEVVATHIMVPNAVVKVSILHLKDEDPEVRSLAARILGCWNILPDTALTAVVARLKDIVSEVRMSAIRALENQDCLPETAIEALIPLFGDENPEVRRHLSYSKLAGHKKLQRPLHRSFLSVPRSRLTSEYRHWGSYSCEEFCALLPSLSLASMKTLLKLWLLQSFETVPRKDEVTHCFVEDGSVYVHAGAKPPVTVPLQKNQLEMFLRARRELWQELEVPGFLSGTD